LRAVVAIEVDRQAGQAVGIVSAALFAGRTPIRKSDEFTGVHRSMVSSMSEKRLQDNSSDEEFGRGERHLPADGAVVRGSLRLPCGPSLVEIRRLTDWDRCLL
jgi:hypothetical protein